ncbi:MAG: NAD(P)/FAD-dependent oxidoreductase [Ktedonobacteraceae bacterium]
MSHVFASNSEIFADDTQHTPLPNDSSAQKSPTRYVHIVILGTGFAGVGMAIQLKQHGYTDFIVLEKATESGGTWRDNTYPGCACDVPSHLYSFSFALNPRWSHAYSSQWEIQEYLHTCMERFGILPHIQWNSELQNATWHEDEQRWHVTTSQGTLTTDILILGNGPLSEPSLPSIKGIKDFAGTLFHSARWRHDYDLQGKRVAVIGTGASAIQFVPRIQPQVEHITLFQRTPPWVLPRMDHPIAAWQQTLFRILPITQRAIRSVIYWQRELFAAGFVYRQNMLKEGIKVAQEHLERQVPDPILRAKLTPTYVLGCKRVLISDDFYPAVSQPNVEVITEHIREVRAQSIVTEDGKEHEVDTIICATGFHVTDAQLPQRIHGRDGMALGDIWSPDPHAYLGTTVAGFPNMFLLIGPNTGVGHTSMVFMIESQVAYILDCLRTMKQRALQTVEVRAEREEVFNTEIQQRMQGTVWVSGCTSWYLDKHGRNTAIWPGFTFEFRRRTKHFDPQHYILTAKEGSTRIGKAIVKRNTSISSS